jgi:SAM-dependent methyltransferase
VSPQRQPRRPAVRRFTDACSLYALSWLLVAARRAPGGRRLASDISEARVRAWYRIVTGEFSESWGRFLNYGYAELTPDGAIPGLALPAEQEPFRFQVQLYARAIGEAGLAGRDVLEVSCGHGGGGLFIRQHCKPASYVGLDANEGAIERCRRLPGSGNARYILGSAYATTLPDACVDAVVNVEASHCYEEPAAFLKEVGRVLRPGGELLLTDFRPAGQVEPLVALLAAKGFELLLREDITANVVHALELESDRKLAQLARYGAGAIERGFRDFFGVAGSPIHRALKSGETAYFRLRLRKP